MEILEKNYVVEMPNGERWAVPVVVIAENRAEHYAHEFSGDINASLIEDTAPLFESDNSEVKNWAKNNMNWSDVMGSAKLLTTGTTDYQDGWANGDVEIL